MFKIQAIQEIVSSTEKALKLVSDQIADEDQIILETEKADDVEKKVKDDKPEELESNNDENTEKNSEMETNVVAKKADEPQMYRALKGVMRVGLLAKGLLLKGDTDVQLIVLCAQKPTKSLLERVFNILLQKINVMIEFFTRD